MKNLKSKQLRYVNISSNNMANKLVYIRYGETLPILASQDTKDSPKKKKKPTKQKIQQTNQPTNKNHHQQKNPPPNKQKPNPNKTKKRYKVEGF